MNEIIINYLKEEENCYKEILSLSKRQKDALINNKGNILDGIIKEKDMWIDKVKQIDDNLIHVINKNNLNNSYEWFIKKIESVLNEIIKIENECRTFIVNNMADMTDEIKNMNRGKQVARLYSTKGIYTPKFINARE
jgi:flagellar biosynthesis/type III secretory pathway chaperone